MSYELQTVLAGECRAFGLIRREVEQQRRKLARLRARLASNTHAQIDRERFALRVGDGHASGLKLWVVTARVHCAQRGFEPDDERLVAQEEGAFLSGRRTR